MNGCLSSLRHRPRAAPDHQRRPKLSLSRLGSQRVRRTPHWTVLAATQMRCLIVPLCLHLSLPVVILSYFLLPQPFFYFAIAVLIRP
ncbi:hypothetical protein VTO42DRAFT_1306 [Malbranchea cinnamomea]